MYKKLRTLQTIDESGAVLIVRLENADVAERAAEAAIAGGFRALDPRRGGGHPPALG
jgi:2-dehydro-3-deoxyphosphogluconate aldolase/(4S)-4-hydroxy-2-oxoglutarate aldolase